MTDDARHSTFGGPLQTGHAAWVGNATKARLGSSLLEGRWEWAALALILAVAAALNFFRLDRLGYANTYYAAAVKSMLQNWHNFFFVSFDPGGFVSVDKPPLGFWIQTAGAKLLGFHGWSILLPQALAGVLSVAVLFILIRRVWGPVAGLVGALTLALTPVAVVANRNNTIDSLLVLVLLLGAWAVSRATESGRLRWLLLASGIVGVGFEIKMLQAFLVLPAFYLLYLLAAPHGWRKRLLHLTAATAVLAVVSLTWAVAVDLTPPGQRPYVGSSQHNSELELALGYNGLNRLLPGGIFRGMRPPGPPPGAASTAGGQALGTDQPTVPAGQTAAPADAAAGAGAAGGFPGGPPAGGGFGGEVGNPGVLRLFQLQLAGQASWLLPLAAIGLLGGAWRSLRRPLDARQQSLILWGTWLLTVAAFFSVASFFHRYYLIMLAPPVAALVGAGLASLWNDYRRPGWKGWLLPLALSVTAAVQGVILASYPNYGRWMTPILAGACGASAVLLVLLRLRKASLQAVYSAVAATVAVLALFLAPSVWSAVSARQTDAGFLPSAGPAQRSFSFPGLGGARGSAGPPPGLPPGGGGQTNTQLVRYLQENRRNERFLVAVPSSMMASSIILETGEPVMAMGGFTGGDPILTTDQLTQDVQAGTVRFFLVAGSPERESVVTDGASTAASPSGVPLQPVPGSLPPTGQLPSGFYPGGPPASPPFSNQPSGELPPLTGSSPPPLPTSAPGQQGSPALPFAGPFGAQSGVESWVSDHCSSVPATEWQSSPSPIETVGFAFAEQLYDCAGAR